MRWVERHSPDPRIIFGEVRSVCDLQASLLATVGIEQCEAVEHVDARFRRRLHRRLAKLTGPQAAGSLCWTILTLHVFTLAVNRALRTCGEALVAALVWTKVWKAYAPGDLVEVVLAWRQVA